nr:MAG TPA: hypothetical protein [Caudoviricetes sp.]
MYSIRSLGYGPLTAAFMQHISPPVNGRGACNECSEASALKVAGIAYTVNDLNSPTASMVRRSAQSLII